MLHEHNIIDNDVHFIISDTGEINLLSDNKDSIIYIQQFLHLSESFTFESPRYIEGHDMSLSNIVNIHFTNIDSKTKEEGKDIYPVDGLKVDEQDENKIIFTCKLKDTCTRYVGLLKFSIIFECYEDDVVIYRWPTDIFSKIMIRKTNYNSESIVIEHSDIISEIQNDIKNIKSELNIVGDISKEKISEAVNEYLTANPIEETDPTVPNWAKQPEKPTYTASEVGALPNTTIIPTTLPNPNALTFTGAVTGSYDGSSPVEINIPEGGGTDVAVDTTLSVAGQAADAKATGEKISELKSDLSQLSDEIANLPSGGSGLTAEQISAFDSFFSTLIGDKESKREKDKLIKLLKGITIVNYTITLNGDNFSIDNDSREVEENQSWSANISFSDGFEAENITVLMGDVDVTETAVGGNTVTINSVTGNVVITIVAREITVPTTLLYSNDGVVFTDGSESLHTGVNLSEYAEFTILMNIKSLTNFMWGNQDIISTGPSLNTVRFGKSGNGAFSISKSDIAYTIPETVIAKKTSNFESSIPFALTFNSGVQKVYSFMDGAMTKTDDVVNSNKFSKMGELIVSPLMEEGYNMGARWLGEIANIKVYSEILSDSAIDEYMRGL